MIRGDEGNEDGGDRVDTDVAVELEQLELLPFFTAIAGVTAKRVVVAVDGGAERL